MIGHHTDVREPRQVYMDEPYVELVILNSSLRDLRYNLVYERLILLAQILDYLLPLLICEDPADRFDV